MKDKLMKHIPAHWKATAMLQGFGLFRIPLLFSLQPRVKEISDEKVVVEMPLNRWSKNHLGSMYFGALAIGADCVVGLLAVHLLEAEGGQASLAFKDFQAEFLRRPEKNVLFVCEEGAQIKKFVKKVLASRERMNLPVKAYALAKGESEPVARFVLTLSLKRKA